MRFIISSTASCLRWLEVSLLGLGDFHELFFSRGSALPALSVGEISFANQKKFTERVVVLLHETVFSSSRVSPSSPPRASAEEEVPVSQTSMSAS